MISQISSRNTKKRNKKVLGAGNIARGFLSLSSIPLTDNFWLWIFWFCVSVSSTWDMSLTVVLDDDMQKFIKLISSQEHN